MVDEISILNSWRDRINKFFHELQAEGWIVDLGSEVALVYSSRVMASGTTMPIESISGMKEKDPAMHVTDITLRIEAHLPLRGD